MSTYGGTERTLNVRMLLICALCGQSVWKRAEADTSSMLTQYFVNGPFLFRTFVMETGPHHHIAIPKSSENVALYRSSDGSCPTISSVF